MPIVPDPYSGFPALGSPNFASSGSDAGLNISTSATELAKDAAARDSSKFMDDSISMVSKLPFLQNFKSMLPSEFTDFLNYHNTTPKQISEQERNEYDRDQILKALEARANQGDEAALELLFNYYGTRANELEARKYNQLREDTVYQRLMDDFKKAGISPYILSGANPVGLNTTSHAFTGSQLVSQQSNKNTVESNEKKAAFESIFKLIGIVIGALLMAA